MKKKTILLLLTIAFSLLSLVGCSFSSNGNVKVTDNNKEYLAQYDKSLQNYINEMTRVLKTFNTSLDGIYTKSMSDQQFAQTLTKQINESNALVEEVESLDVNPELFETHQTVIALINRSHQLLLTAVDSANSASEEGGTEIDKDSLRQEYMEIKIEQASIANQWKILRQELNKSDGKVASGE